MTWHKYPDERPERDTFCLVTVEHDGMRIVDDALYMAHGSNDGYFMQCNDVEERWFTLKNVIAWMKYPLPYNPEKTGG